MNITQELTDKTAEREEAMRRRKLARKRWPALGTKATFRRSRASQHTWLHGEEEDGEAKLPANSVELGPMQNGGDSAGRS